MVDEAAAAQVDPGEAERALCVAAGDAHEVVVDAERIGVRTDAQRHRFGQRAQHELAEDHVVDDALAVRQVAPFELPGQLGRPEIVEGPVVEVDAGQRRGDGLEHRHLHVGETVVGPHRGGDRAPHRHDLIEIGLGMIERHRRHRRSYSESARLVDAGPMT